MKKTPPTLEDLAKPTSTLQDFIDFFKSKPAKDWIVDKLVNNCGKKFCAVGWLGWHEDWKPVRRKIFGERMPAIGISHNDLVIANNGKLDDTVTNRRRGIKTRVINYLKSLSKP